MVRRKTRGQFFITVLIVPLIIACGCNQDARLAGGYENVPTVDIHMNQVCAMVKPRVTYI